MAVFIGATKNTTAVRCAWKINYAVRNIINPALSKQYSHRSYKERHHIAIDTSSLFVSRIGVRNDNDLVWVGRAANYAAKLCSIREYDTIFLTKEVFNMMLNPAKFSANGASRCGKNDAGVSEQCEGLPTAYLGADRPGAAYCNVTSQFGNRRLNEQDPLSVLDARLRFAFHSLASGQKTS